MALPGDNLRDRYLIKRELGRGGMAEVHLAYDAFTERDVAVKLTKLSLFDDQRIGLRLKKQWLNEARLAGKLHHPHIVEVYEAGVSDENAFLVMEYIEGDSLQKYVGGDGLLPVNLVTDIAFKVGTALDYASHLGMLHRDIKPANVIRGKGGAIKVMDFGACYFTNVDETQVYDVGTLPFMPPEHFKKQAPSVQTDIYALGVMAYQLLTGRWPFNADSFHALVQEKLHEDFVPLEIRRKDLPRELRFVVHRAMHRDMDVRYASWREFCDELARALPEGERPREMVFESARFSALRTLALLRDFDEAQLWELVHLSRWIEKKEGELVFSEGDPGDRVFVVVKGEIIVTRNGTALNTISTGECVGEISFLDEEEQKRTASATAATPSTLIEMETQALRSASSALQGTLLKTFVRVMVSRLKQGDARFLAHLSKR